MNPVRVALLLCVCWFVGICDASACDCARAAGCQKITLNGDLFTATALGIVEPRFGELDPLLGMGFPKRKVRMKVKESFTSNHRVGEEVIVETGLGGGDCGYPFVAGESYLVDAYAHDGRLGTGICSITASEGTSIAMIRGLRRLASGERLADLTGLLATSGEVTKSGKDEPIANVPLTLSSKSNGATFRTTTDEAGVYELKILPPGTYTISAVLPSNRLLTPAYDDAGNERPPGLTIPDSGGVGARCYLDLQAGSTGGIAGRVVDSAGHGIAGFLEVYAADAPENRGWTEAQSVEADGIFDIRSMKDGRYLLSFKLDDDKKGQWFYPGVRSRSGAQVVVIKDEHLTGPLVFKVE